jgi:hypothetical protein
MRKFKDNEFKTCCTQNPICVAVAINKNGVAVRDTKDPTKTTLTYTGEEWDNFVAGVKAGKFDRK